MGRGSSMSRLREQSKASPVLTSDPDVGAAAMLLTSPLGASLGHHAPSGT